MSSCVNCRRVFDSSKQNRLLSTAWFVRKKDITDPQYLIDRLEMSPEDANLVIERVADKCYSHEEFVSFLKDELQIHDQRKAS